MTRATGKPPADAMASATSTVCQAKQVKAHQRKQAIAATTPQKAYVSSFSMVLYCTGSSLVTGYAGSTWFLPTVHTKADALGSGDRPSYHRRSHLVFLPRSTLGHRPGTGRTQMRHQGFCGGTQFQIRRTAFTAADQLHTEVVLARPSHSTGHAIPPSGFSHRVSMTRSMPTRQVASWSKLLRGRILFGSSFLLSPRQIQPREGKSSRGERH